MTKLSPANSIGRNETASKTLAPLIRCWILESFVDMTTRNFCFTFFPDEQHTEADFQKRLVSLCRYAIYGREICPTTHRLHLQGYAELPKSLRFAGIKSALFASIHLESRKGTREQARAYCQKDGDVFEHGTFESKQGSRTDLDPVRRTAMEHGLRRVTAEFGYQQIKVAESFLVWNEDRRNWKPIVWWYYGATGLGKSRRARHEIQALGYSEEEVYTKSDGAKWWPGYDRHPAVILDDFRPSWWCITEMLSLLDRYEKRVEFKGGYRQFVPKIIVVTSAISPHDCYENTGEAVNQLIRRIDNIDRFIFEWFPPTEPTTTPFLENTMINSDAEVDLDI